MITFYKHGFIARLIMFCFQCGVVTILPFPPFTGTLHVYCLFFGFCGCYNVISAPQQLRTFRVGDYFSIVFVAICPAEENLLFVSHFAADESKKVLFSWPLCFHGSRSIFGFVQYSQLLLYLIFFIQYLSLLVTVFLSNETKKLWILFLMFTTDKRLIKKSSFLLV